MFSRIRPDRSPSARPAPKVPGNALTAPDPSVDFSPAPTPGRLRRSTAAVTDPLGGSPVPADVQHFLRRSRGGGAALPAALGTSMGEELGADLRSVRVHTGPESDAAARALQATAFADGLDLHFRNGTYAPTTQAGQRLLAHEVSHVAQDGATAASPTVGRADDPAEQAADRTADRIVGALRRSPTPATVISRDGAQVAAQWRDTLPLQRSAVGNHRIPVRRLFPGDEHPRAQSPETAVTLLTDEKSLTTTSPDQVSAGGPGQADLSPAALQYCEVLSKLMGEAQKEKMKELLRTSHPDKGGTDEEFQAVWAAIKWLQQKNESEEKKGGGPTKLLTSGKFDTKDPRKATLDGHLAGTSASPAPKVDPSAPGKLDFVWYWTEIKSFPADVTAAIDAFSSSSNAVDQARDLLLPKMTGKLQSWFTAELNGLAARMAALGGRAIATADRAAALADVTLLSTDLAQLLTMATDRLADAEKARDIAAQLEVERLQREEEERLAAEEARAEQEKEEREKQAAEEKATKEAADKKEADEKAAAEKADAQKKDEDAKKAVEDKREAEEKRLKQLKEDRAKAEKDRADKRAAEQQRLDDEAARRDQEEQDNEATFGDKTASHAAAVKVGDSLASFDYDAKIKQLDAALATAEKEAAELAKKAQKKKPQGKSKTISATSLPVEEDPALVEVTPTPEGDHAAGVAEATGRRTDTTNRTVSELGAVATSPVGQALPDADLAWVLSESKGSVELAGGLAELVGHQPDGLAVAKKLVSGFDVKRLAPVCGRLLDDQAPAELTPETAALLEGCASKPYRRTFRTWLWGCVRNGTLESALELCRPFSDTLGTVALVAPVLGFTENTGTFLQILQKCKAKQADVTTLLALSTAAGFDKLLNAMRNKDLAAADVCTVMTPVHLARFTLLELTRLCDTWPKDLALVAELLPLAEPHCPSLIGLLINVGELGRSKPLLVTALQAEAQLVDKIPTFSITIRQPEDRYVGPRNLREHNRTVGARTGFLALNFAGSTGKLNTHWDSMGTQRGKISSMHIKNAEDTGRGLELNKWMQFFKELPAAVVLAQNTGNPTGGQLSL
ncbi:hypothetical protein ABIB25_003019 [Nakamurella sp. UYEF19]|uniref:eCIS core domain-containing protein n=1 Tax=Nakamurella sp. UYEF19 TaxID=1756392 RepID=UPI003391419A